MGNSGWEDDPRGRSRPPRDGRTRDDDRPPGRSSPRMERGAYGSRSGSSGQYRPGRPPPDRDEYVPYGERDRAGDRSMRGARPPGRGDSWEAPRVRQPGQGGPGGSNGRNRAPARGGLWDDEPSRQRRPGDPRGRGMGGRPDPRDPRMMRRGLVPDEEEEEEKSSLSAGKALLIVVLMFVLGAGGAYGYFKLSTPKVSTDSPAPAGGATPASTTTPAASPTASPPHALAPSAPSRYAVYVLPAPMR